MVPPRQPFTVAVYALILLNCVCLAIEGPPNSKFMAAHPDVAEALYAANLVFFVAFWLEAVLKVVADGLVRTEEAYLRSGWNLGC